MNQRENEIKKDNLKYNAADIIIAVQIIDQLEETLEVIYYLMEHKNIDSFVLMLIKADDINLNTLLEYEKRDTDILFEIDKERSINVLLCQDTKVDGGYHFAERVIKDILIQEGSNIYCTEVEVRSTHNSIKNIVFALIDLFKKAQAENKTNEIVYKSLN